MSLSPHIVASNSAARTGKAGQPDLGGQASVVQQRLTHARLLPAKAAAARARLWALAVAVLLTCCLPVLAATGSLRISGGFFQYWDELYNWPPETWQAVLGSMKDARMNTVIIQMQVTENSDGSLHSYISPAGKMDATETILYYADTNGFRVFLGLYGPNWNHDMTGSNFLFETQSRMGVVARQVWDRYLSGGHHKSFAGWYIPYESWTGNYTQAEVDRLRGFFQAIHASCQQISGDMPLLISPFISVSRPSPCRVEELYRQILNQSGIDILMLQDSVGAQQWETNIQQRVAPYFQAFQNACNATGVKLWANIESFRTLNNVVGPCDVARMKKQLDASGPFVEDFITFDFVHYMNPVAFLRSWDLTRRTQMQQFYADYKAAFVDADYAPFARPTLSAGVSEQHLRLEWRGVPDDQFQVQTKSNLADSKWTSLSASVQTNGSRFWFTNATLVNPPACYYQVAKLPRLQVPDSMVYIPPGSFLMGTPTNDPNRLYYELSPFHVSLTRGFWINRFEVTQSEYQNLMCTNPSSHTGDLECPVDNVAWRNATNYCALLTQQERAALRLPAGYLYRLPTEAEWEYAARAGTTNWFSFGDAETLLPDYAWYNANSSHIPHPVGKLLPNPWGLHDVHGNVFEWCWDYIGTAPSQPVTDYRGAVDGIYHAIRGGAFSFPWVDCRSSWHVGYSGASVPSGVGFRVVLAPE